MTLVLLILPTHKPNLARVAVEVAVPEGEATRHQGAAVVVATYKKSGGRLADPRRIVTYGTVSRKKTILFLLAVNLKITPFLVVFVLLVV